jgi:hypothetical protein
MEYRSLGRTGAQVSIWCLDVMTFGWKTVFRKGSSKLPFVASTGCSERLGQLFADLAANSIGQI